MDRKLHLSTECRESFVEEDVSELEVEELIPFLHTQSPPGIFTTPEVAGLAPLASAPQGGVYSGQREKGAEACKALHKYSSTIPYLLFRNNPKKKL